MTLRSHVEKNHVNYFVFNECIHRKHSIRFDDDADHADDDCQSSQFVTTHWIERKKIKEKKEI